MSALLVLVQRDPAKQLFSHRDPEQLILFLRELLASDDVTLLSLPVSWSNYDSVFHGAEGERATLQWAITGGRLLAGLDIATAGPTVQLKRPDIVAQLSQAIADFGAEAVSELPEAIGELPEADTNFVSDLASFYREGADGQAAVLFVDSLDESGNE